MRHLHAICALLLAGAALQAQETVRIEITGTVVDGAGLPVPGATVMVPGRAELGGAVTSETGAFRIRVPKGSVLEVSCIGYQARRRTFDDPLDWLVVLEEESELLQDVIVVGYGVQKKESVVGAISQVSSDDLLRTGTTNVTNAIAGKLSGVQTVQTSGQPGADDATIYIRGISSWNGSTPLVMVDGIERTFNALDPNEIETISVLKDASATAVFGAKGANGVILVTTKSGQEGATKMRLTEDYGLSQATRLPEHIASVDIIEAANVAYKNDGSFTSLYPQSTIDASRYGTDSIRYPDTDWYELLLNDFAQSWNANFNVSGGTKKIKYFLSVSYLNEGSIVKSIHPAGNTKFDYNRFNYRSNIDFRPTSSTTLSLRMGGSTGIRQQPDDVMVASLFTTMYSAATCLFPAYYPEWALELYPDPDYPEDSGIRLASHGSTLYNNPYYYLMQGDFDQVTVSKLNTDLVLDQKLDFITKGLRASAKASLTTSFTRTSLAGVEDIPRYTLDWNIVDAGIGNPWTATKVITNGEIYVQDPYKVTPSGDVTASANVFYWEAALNYDRTFAKRHHLTAMALMNRRQQLTDAQFPRRSEAYVGRVTYDYKGKYLLEGNVGYTGSEQFSPKNRYGLFPSLAAGYVVSKEKWWKRAMPWWSRFKVRYSDGLIGSDNASARWLYFSSYEKSGNYIVESEAANETARWETARKRDLGVESGWWDDALTFSIDLYDERRTDMLVTPVVTPLVAVGFKDVNTGSMKKHGIDIELKYRHDTAAGLHWAVGGMLGLNENRILSYSDPAYSPEYQKYADKPYQSQRKGVTLLGDGYFHSIDEIHGYPAYSTNWSTVYPGVYKYLDYTVDGTVNGDDLHPVAGSAYPPCVYSWSGEFSWKGFSFNMLWYGVYGKWTGYNRCFEKEFIRGDPVVHKSQLDYWSPARTDGTHAALSFSDAMYTVGGGNATGGYTVAIPGHTWRKSDYLSLKEVSLVYRFDAAALKRMGVSGLSMTLTGNNLLTLTDLLEGNPQATSQMASTYPVMRVVKLGVKLDF